MSFVSVLLLCLAVPLNGQLPMTIMVGSPNEFSQDWNTQNSGSTQTTTLSCWRNFHHWLHWKQQVMKIQSGGRHFSFRFVTKFWWRLCITDATSSPNDDPDNNVHGANMGPIWGRQDPGGPHVGPMNFAISQVLSPTAKLCCLENYLEGHTRCSKLHPNQTRPTNTCWCPNEVMSKWSNYIKQSADVCLGVESKNPGLSSITRRT